MELINNTTKILKDDLSVEIKQGSKLSIAAACFSIYAFQKLKEQLSQIDELRFIFTSPTFVTEKAPKERREFYIPRLARERSLYGTEFEIKLRNELTQKAIARECAEWIRRKVTFKSNVSDKFIQGQIVVDGVGYTPIKDFTTVELGCEKGNVISTTIIKDASLARTLLSDFNEIWNDSKVLQVVTDEVIDSITAAYNENSPDFIYFVTLYNIFNEFLEDVSEDVLPNEATGFKESKIWGMLYNFQKDAALAIINKLEKYNGCILADSVGLGKTFTALAVIKYYENRNKSVLVLCPKKLTNNWNTYKDNYVNNPIAADRLRYDVLYHTDLNRTHGTSNGLDLGRLNWGNYDLVVIDESHNFRNGGKLVENPDEDTKDNRYVTLMKKVIRAGVKTKVLMLSATPVNNRFNDLKNQLALAYEGHTDYIDEKLNTTRSIDEIFKNAQRAFNTWSKWEPCDRTTENLLKMLDFDFFEVLDSVTIARSRKHIQKYYDMADIGTFPTRLKPISLRPHLTDLEGAISYNEIFEQLMLLTLTIYTPTHYILPSKMEKYAELYGDNKVNVGFTQANREQGIRRLTAINLMKRKLCDQDDRTSQILQFRLEGETLQEIGDLFELSRERVRQITVKFVHKLPLFFEDYFNEPFQYFYISKAKFIKAFPEVTKEGYEFLSLRYPEGKVVLTHESLKEYHGLWKERLAEFLSEEEEQNDKETISKIEVMTRVLISNSDRSLSMDELEDEYYSYIKQKGYPENRLKINLRTVKNYLRDTKSIVFNCDNKVRYCAADPNIIWEQIDFTRYQNTVISSELIFNDYQELMEEADIRDGYELFYIIKSSLSMWDAKRFVIRCRRVPVVVMGEASEEMQAIKLLKEISPVLQADYYAAYEERYGVRRESANGNPAIHNTVGAYYADGKYAIDVPAIDERDIQPLLSALSKKPLWFIEDMEKLFGEVCVHTTQDAFNAAAFRRIGYNLHET